MMRAGHVGFSVLLILGLVACRQQGLDPEDAALLESSGTADVVTQASAAPAAAPVASSTAPAVPATVLSESAVTIGSAVAADGRASAAKPEYAVSDTVHASVAVAGYPVGKAVTIYWFGADGTSVKTDSRQIKAGDAFVSFALGRADGMKAGTYSAQVDIDDVPAGMADFRVQ